MTRTEILNELRAVLADTRKPYGWTDTRCLRWLSDGQDKFCTLTGFWTDKTNYTITTVLGQQDYAISDRIISVKSIWDGTRQLVDLAECLLEPADGFPDVTPQTPQTYRTDLESGLITIIEPVLAGIVLTLRVHRKSRIAFGTSGAAAELPEEFQYAMIEYAAAKAFGDHDRELQDPVKAADHMANFKALVKDGSKAYRRLTGDYADVVGNPLYVV